MIRLARIATLSANIFLTVVFVAVGVSKLKSPSAVRWSERFEHWGFPAEASYVIGVFEVLSGIGMLIPQWRQAAALSLSVLMAGALITHIINGEFLRVIPPLCFGGLASFMYWSNRRLTRE